MNIFSVLLSLMSFLSISQGLRGAGRGLTSRPSRGRGPIVIADLVEKTKDNIFRDRGTFPVIGDNPSVSPSTTSESLADE